MMGLWLVVWLGLQIPGTVSPVVVTARDFALDVPSQIAGPLVYVKFENRGREPHYLRFLRISDDRTLDDFVAWRKAGGPLPAWLRGAGGAGTLAPGEEIEFRAALAPGRYVVMCGHPSPDGTPHVDKGMYAILSVTGTGTVGERLADATFLFSEKGMTFFGQPQQGAYTFLASNVTTGSHQLLLVRLPSRVSETTELDWFRQGNKGPRPGHPVGGAIDLPPGEEARFRLALTPGRYLAFCSVATGGQRHFDAGEVARFEIK